MTRVLKGVIVATLLLASVFVGLRIGLEVSESSLYVWTDYYRMRTNTPIQGVRFVDAKIPCRGQEASCACTIEMLGDRSPVSYRIIYSTDWRCGVRSERARARLEVCRARMGLNEPSERAEECAEWYDN